MPDKSFEVCSITLTDYSVMGGIQSFIQSLDDSLLKAKIQSKIISLGFELKEKDMILKAYRIPLLGMYPYLLISTFLIALTFSIKRRRERCLIHAHDMLFGGLIGVFIKLMLRSPLVITDHGLQSLVEAYAYAKKHGDTFLSQLNRAFLLLVERFVATNADKIMCVSEYSYNYFLQRGITPTKMKIVRNGINVKMFKPKRPIFSRDHITMLYAGRFSAEKGMDALIKVFSLLTKNYRNLKLLIVGEGPDKASIRKMIEKLKIDRKVALLSPVKRTDMVNLYNNSDIVLIPSTVETGTPLVLLEAMACERVVIVNLSGSLPLVVNGGGLIVPFNNPPRATELIKRILNDNKEALRLAKLARERVVKSFSWQNCFEEILNTYVSLGIPGLDMSKLKS